MKGECDFVELQRMYLTHRLIIATRSKCSFSNVAGVHVLPVCTTCVPSVHPVMETPRTWICSRISNLLCEIQILTKKIQVVAMITWIAKDGNK